MKWGNFTQNPNKLSYMHILTPHGIAQKLRLTTYFLKRKEEEYEHLQVEIRALRQELGFHHRTATPRLMVNEREPAQMGASGMPVQNNTVTPKTQPPSGLATLMGRNLIRLMGGAGATPKGVVGRRTGGATRDRKLADLSLSKCGNLSSICISKVEVIRKVV